VVAFSSAEGIIHSPCARCWGPYAEPSIAVWQAAASPGPCRAGLPGSRFPVLVGAHSAGWSVPERSSAQTRRLAQRPCPRLPCRWPPSGSSCASWRLNDFRPFLEPRSGLLVRIAARRIPLISAAVARQACLAMIQLEATGASISRFHVRLKPSFGIRHKPLLSGVQVG